MKKTLTLLVLLALMKAALAQTDSSSSKSPWELNADLSYYFMPDDFFLLPVVSADHTHLHLEARYNYEDNQTFSLFGGYNFSFGSKFSVDVTPIGGIVFGNTSGIAPGYEIELTFWKLGLYSEGEYLFVLDDYNDNFFYNWSELYYVPADWIWFGIAAQRIREKKTGLDLQRGVMLALSKKYFTVTGYYFNPFTPRDFGVLTVGVSFQ